MMRVEARKRNLLLVIWDYVYDLWLVFMKSEKDTLTFFRRGIANVIAVSYSASLLYYYHFILSDLRYWVILVVAASSLILGLFVKRKRNWRWNVSSPHKSDHEKPGFLEQKAYQLCVIHLILGIIMAVFQEIPKVEKFFFG